MARRNKDPDISGVPVVEEPSGLTSHDVVDVVRRAAGVAAPDVVLLRPDGELVAGQ